MSAAEQVAVPLQTIIDITFQVAVNGHLDSAAEVSRDQIGEIYEAARLAMAERAQLVKALKEMVDRYGPDHSTLQETPWDRARALLRALGETTC